MSLRAGTAKLDITPPAGALLAAFPRGPERLPRRAQGALDPLFVRALALADDTTAVLLASVDVCIIRRESVLRIRESVCDRIAEIIPENILIAATHTHAGAETSFLFGSRADDPEVLSIEAKIADTLVQAWQELETVELGWAKPTLPLSHNRRVQDKHGHSTMVLEKTAATTGPVDPDLLILQFTTNAGAVKALLFHYTAHALTLGPANDFFSADYPGYACRMLEQAFPGSTALFFNGAAGNVHPVQCMRPGTDALEAIGRELGNAVLKAVPQTTPVANPRLRIESAILEFANRADPTLLVTVECGVLQIGPVSLGFVPGEFFVEFQLGFKQACAPALATLIGYANDWCGYAPTAAAYAQGGYGVNQARQDPPAYSRTCLPPGAGEQVIENLIATAARWLPPH